MRIKLNNILYNLKQPIISYGVIAFTIIDNNIKFLLINKKNTVGFCDIVKGNYDKNDIEMTLNNITKILTYKEVDMILHNSFDIIWKYMWKKNIDLNSKAVFEKNERP